MTAPAVDAPIVPDDAIPAPAAPSGWRGPIMPINTRSGDGRIMVLDETITDPPCRPLPLPLSAQKHVDEGHDGAVVVGLIRRVWLQDGHVWAEGTFNDDEDGREWAQRVANGQRWISADLSDIQAEEIPLDEQGAEMDTAAADVVLDLEVESLIRVTEWKLMGATLCAGPAFETAHIEAATVEPSGLTASLIAAGIAYDADDFADPRLGELTALQVTDDGRVFGHLAGWRSCHIGFQGACVTAPRSASNYRYFHQGAVRLADGRDLPVGKITIGTGHAPTRPGVGATAAAAHYDNTGSVICVVRCGEDQHGVWVAGRTLPGTSDTRLDELRRSGISGDWRTVTPGGGLELVAALAVNVPGFPIPRTQSMAASGEAALVAAGIVTPATARAVDASLRRARAGVLAKRMHAIRTRDLRARMNTLKAHTLRARMIALVAAPVEEDGTQLQGGQRIVRTQEGATRYGVEVGQPIPTGSARTQAVEKEWESIKAENPAGAKATKGGSGSGSSKKSTDSTTKGQVPSGSKKLGSSTPARKSGDTAYMEEDESPDKGAKGGKLVNFENGVAYYSDGTLSDGKGWYEQSETKTSSSKSTKTSTGTSSKTSTTGTKATSTTTGTSTAAKDPITSFVEALVNALAPKPAPSGNSGAPAAGPPESGPTPEQRQRLQSLLDRLQTHLDARDQNQRNKGATNGM